MRLLILFFILCFAWQAGASWQVQLNNLPANMREPLLKEFPNLEKQRITRGKMDEIIRWLHREMQADRVLFSETSPGVVTIDVQRISRIHQVNFSGLSALSESEARAFIPFNRNDPYDEEILLEGGERLREAHRELGYLNAEIDVEMPTNEKGQIILNVKVRENKRTRISEIEINTASSELNTLLQKVTRSYKNKPLTDSTISELNLSLRESLNSNGRYLAEIIGPEARFNADETIANLTYRIEKIDRYLIDFRGHQAQTKSTLENVLDLKNYSSSNPNLAADLTQKLRAYYLQEGFARVEIQTEMSEGRGPNTRNLVFLIDEGSQIKIEKYVFSGRFSRDPEYYAEFIRKNTTPLISRGYYNKDDLEVGINNLISELRNQGHLLAKIISSRTQYNRTKDKVTVYINLEEGPATLVDSIEFVDNISFNREQLLQILNLELNEPLRLNEFEKSIQRLKSHYYEHGFIEMLLLNEKEDLVTYNSDSTRARLKFHIFEGPRVFVSSIILDGNHFTKDYVILNEIDLEVGKTVTPSKIDESIARLQRIGHFSSVEIRTLEEKTTVSERTVLIRVTERDPGIFTMGFGATNERQFTLRGYTGIAYRNLLGTGRGISLRLDGNYNVADVKYLENKVAVGYLEPYLFNTRVRGRVNLSRSKLVADYEQKRVTELNQTTWSVEKDLTSRILGIWDVLSVATVRDFSLVDDPSVDDTPLNIASTGPTLEFEYRDNIFNATRGTFSRISAEYASPRLGSSETIEYWRSTAMFNHYWNLGPGPWVWANSWRLGVIENTSTHVNGGVPYDKKGFILGGRSTIRGYEAGTSEVFPSRRDLGDSQYLLKTRAKMGLFKSEIRFPLIGNLGGAFFYDGGYVEIEGLKFIDYYRDSIGFGLRYNTPVGPLNLEFGWKLDRREDEETGRFHLSIGTF